MARSQVYDACYHGCANDCDDPNFACNACQRTMQAGAACDGNKMWNWKDADRYPASCLTTIARNMMGDALEQLKKSYRNQYALIVLTVLGGVLGAVITYIVWRRLTMTKAERREQKMNKKAKRASLGHPASCRSSSSSSSSSSSAHSRAGSGSRPGTSSSGGSGSGIGKKAAMTAVLGLIGGAKPAQAYACTGRDMTWNQYFVSPVNGNTGSNVAILGVVHGWFRNCNDKRDCVKRCTDTCGTDSSGHKSCRNSCSDDCHTTTVTDRMPKQYVDDIVPRVRACGFTTVDSLASADMAGLTVRVANANIERNHWVRISVNSLNATRPDETDEMILAEGGMTFC
ncbi:hypothetical protein B0T26DRAFT_672399 [Lasiosphaeria miniovina]|uniref:Uncharacterized protein n=1 Tax=Lasiosphaeria miniovina TaxID=1954250 RepID=A0AA40E4G8_9PEZI|nr:uncharacterized protein B0T26DRAFT_672399 [Lasiosphaeria miniovina]KAK0727774.1 hypothetical protein B0T26DRAFT_672399 [Lasiosphaeria miniovina]